MRLDAFAGIRAQMKEKTLVRDPRDAHPMPETHPPQAMHAREPHGALKRTHLPLAAEQIEEIVNASQEACDHHDADGHPGEALIPIEHQRQCQHRDDYEQPSHDRRAVLVRAAGQRHGILMIAQSQNLKPVQEIGEQRRPDKRDHARKHEVSETGGDEGEEHGTSAKIKSQNPK